MSAPSEKDGRLALALARGMTQAEAAAEAGLSERTVTRRLDDPAFVALVARARHRLHERAVGKLAGAAEKAIDKLIELLGDEDAVVQFRAAKAILDQDVKFGSFHDLARQVAEIRESLRARVGT